MEVTGHKETSLTGEGSIRMYGDDPKLLAGATPEPIFSPSDLEQLCFRRYNPFRQLNAHNLSDALDQFDSGVLMYAARFWKQIVKRDDTVQSVKSKREEAVALREVIHNPVDDSPEAKDQAAALKMFYRNLRAGDALNRHTTGGMPLLLTQMMEAVAFLYAVHHIVWEPDAETQWELPSGKTVPALRALFELVPLEFFEARTGELRFLGLSLGFTGETLAPNNWLVSTGPGLMLAVCSLFYFKRLAQHDLINFSEKFGTPGIEVCTTGGKDSPEGEAARQLLRSISGNWRGVRYGADKNEVNFLWPEGGTSATSLPMDKIIEDQKRAITIIWLGADLSTMSRGGNERAVGSLAQEDEREKRERADCARISETLQASIDPIVIKWFFGDDAPILAQTVVESPINEDRSLLADLVQQTVSMGAQVPVERTMKRLGVPIANEGEEAFTAPAQAGTPLTDEPEGAINAVELRELLEMSDQDFNIAINALATNTNSHHDEKGRFASVEAQIARGQKSMRTSLDEKADVLNAMHHPDLGMIDFRHGTPGDPADEFKGGFGISHIAAKHGEDDAMKMPEVIARGKASHQGKRVVIEHGSYRAVLAKDFKGQPVNKWLVTGFEKKKGNR